MGKKVPDKIQNPLITLSSADEATYLLSNAKRLRRSENEFVRRNIFINPDQTPAEAKAAYDLRCARRSRRTDRTHGMSVDASAYQTSLSASAAPFVPISASDLQSGSVSDQGSSSGRPTSGKTAD